MPDQTCVLGYLYLMVQYGVMIKLKKNKKKTTYICVFISFHSNESIKYHPVCL